ncbi:MAG TPA: hypothetical protein VMP13_05325 [Acidimicrobiia bacterium]|nr:hypothetical protein [Acidimicrobiia bacterium]
MARSQPDSHLISRMTALLWLVAIPVIAVVALSWLHRPPEIFAAEVVESSVESTGTGLVGDVRWTDGDGIRQVRNLELTSAHVESGSVSVAADPSGEVRVVDPARETGPTVILLAITALIGLAFAVVVLATVRGYGYVRGTGQY